MIKVKRTQTNPNSLANLKPCKPGEVRNPGGRPKKKPITERYEKIIEMPLSDEERNKLKLPAYLRSRIKTVGDMIAYGQAQAAAKGRAENAREIREAIEGKSQAPDTAIGIEGKEVRVIIRHIGGSE